MFERIIYALMYLVGLALCFWLVVWGLGAIGLALPAMVEKCLLVLLILVAILILYRLLFSGGIRWWPNPPA